MVREAYANWNSLEEVDNGNVNETALLTQGHEIVDDQYPNHPQAMIRTSTAYDQSLYLPSNSHMVECMSDNWQLHSPYFSTLQIQHSISESSSDGDLTSHGIP